MSSSCPFRPRAGLVPRRALAVLACGVIVAAAPVHAQSAPACPASHDVRVAFPPSLPDGGSCVDHAPPSNYVRASAEIPAGQETELHVIGVYEGQKAATDGGRDASVPGHVGVTVHASPKPILLVLSAYASVRWELRLDPGARLARVVTQGYDAQEVVGAPAGTRIETRGRGQACGYAYGWEVAANSGGGSYLDMIASLRAATGLTEKSFQGCYAGVSFEVPFRAEPAPYVPPRQPGDESRDRADVDVPACRRVLAEPGGSCLTRTGEAIEVVGLDSGTLCPVVRTPGATPDPSEASLAWRGELVYVCGAGGLTRISLRDGSSVALGLPCRAVTDFADGLLVQPPGLAGPDDYRWYADLDAILHDHVDEVLPAVQRNSRMTARGRLVYSAWHSTGTIDVADVVHGSARPPVELEGYDGWILGLATTEDGRLVISGDSWGRTLRIFDLKTGQSLATLPLARAAFGLSCVTAAERRRATAPATRPHLPVLR